MVTAILMPTCAPADPGAFWTLLQIAGGFHCYRFAT